MGTPRLRSARRAARIAVVGLLLGGLLSLLGATVPLHAQAAFMTITTPACGAGTTYCYTPNSFVASAGSSYSFTNSTTRNHTVAYQSGPSVFSTSASVAPSGTGSFTVPTINGTYQWKCSIHGFNSMHGTFTISDGTPPTPVPTPKPTSIAITAHTPNPSTSAQSVSMTATVSSGLGTPTGGSVTFKDGGVSIGSATLSAGQATLGHTFPAGSHSLSAQYGGSASWAASGPSVAVTQNVNPAPTAPPTATHPATSAPGHTATPSTPKPTTAKTPTPTAIPGAKTTATTIASSAEPGVLGSPLTFTATVKAADGSAASGNVLFKDGDTELGSSPLSAGTASLSTTKLTAGDHTIVASFAGDATWGPSESAPLTQTIQVGGTPGAAVVVTPTPTPAPTSGARTSDSSPTAAIVGGVLIVLILAGLGTWYFVLRPRRTPPAG